MDRDLDIALSQFAPGSQTIKDKAVHTAVGVVDLRPEGQKVASSNGFTPALPDSNKHPLGFCSNCQAVIPLPEMLAVAGGQIPLFRTCDVCGENKLRPLDVREPRGFFTDLNPRDFDGIFEWQARATRPTLSFRKDNGSNFRNAGNCRVSDMSDFIVSVNDNGGNGGFDFRSVKVDGQSRPGAFAALTSGENDEDDTKRVTVYGNSYRVALVSRRKTDVLLVKIAEWPQGIKADPTTVEGRAAWYSFAFWLRVAAGALLDVDTQELQAGLQTIGGTLGPEGQAFLCDQLENGAGYCNYLGKQDAFLDLLRQARPSDVNSIARKWLAQTDPATGDKGHGCKCDTSCNLCLRDYFNMPYHGLLDWRLALDMARLALNPDTVLDLETSWEGELNPWSKLLEPSTGALPAMMRRLQYDRIEAFGRLKGFVHVSGHKVLLACHPLWQDDYADWQQSRDEALRRYVGATVERMNPYLAVRRPADYL